MRYATGMSRRKRRTRNNRERLIPVRISKWFNYVKMKTVTIYGASDDLIELEGDIRDEINPRNEDEPTRLAFSDGTVLSVVYDSDGCWRVTRVAEGSAKMEKVEAEGPDSNNYSDRVTLTGEIRWCVAGEYMAKVK